MMLPPPSETANQVIFPRERADAANLVNVTEVTERAVWAMYDAMRGAVTGGRKTAPRRRAR